MLTLAAMVGYQMEVFSRTVVYMLLLLHLPNRKALPGQSQPMPYTIVADDAFPL